MFKVIISPEAWRFYDKLFYADRGHFDRVMRAVISLREDPYQGKPLRRDLKGSYSLRVGMYRIIYTIERHIVTVCVVNIGHRKDVYFS